MNTHISLGKLFGLFLSVLGLFCVLPEVSAQSINGTQQLLNRGFEDYDNLGSKNVEPVGWNSFMTAKTAGGIVDQGKDQRLERTTERRPGTAGMYGMRVYSTSIIGINANGNVTTGRINMGSATATDASNYNFTDRAAEGFNFPFTVVPDSMVVWAKYAPNSASDQGQVKAIIHNDNATIDPGTNMNQAVAIALANPTKQDGGWVRYSVPFDRSGCGSKDARYILVSITTNKTPGGGAAQLWVDDILFVYNPTISLNKLPVTSFNMRNGAPTVSIPFTVKGTLALNANSAQKSRVVAELSDADGNFSNPVVIGSMETEESGVLTATIPATTPLGEHYKVRLRGVDRNVLSEPCTEDIVLMRGYTISAQSANPDQGSVTGSGAYKEGGEAVVTALPFTGYHFDRWEENGETVAGAGATYRFTADRDRTLKAFFAINTYRLELLVEGNGTVGTQSGKYTFDHNARVRLEASPDEGYAFDGYYSEGVLLSQNENYQFNIVQDMRITAKFEREKVSIAVSTQQSDLGSVSGSGLYESESTVRVTATPMPYCRFVAWMEGRDTVSKDPVYTFTAQKRRVLTAVFTQEYHTVSVSSNIVDAGILAGGGRYSAANGNTTIILQAEPNRGYEFLYWKSDKDGREYEDNPFTVLEEGRLTEDLSYTAWFAVEEYNIALESVPAGAGTLEGAGIYPFRSHVTLRARPLDYYDFVAWVRIDHGFSDTVRQNPLVFSIEEGRDRRYRALFSLKKHEVSLSAQPEAYGTVSGAGVYSHFDTAVLQAEAKAGYEFLYWGVRRGLNIDKVSEENPCKVEVLQDMARIAVFSERRRNIQAVSLPAQAGKVQGQGLYASGSYALLTAEPAYGYRFVQWEDARQNAGSKDSRLNLQVKTDTTVYARFAPLRYTFTLMTEGSSPIGQVRIGEGSFGTMHIREVYYGDTLYLEANPVKEGYAFTQWRMFYTKDGKTRDSLYSRSMQTTCVVNGETLIVAYFNPNSHHISATVAPQASCGEVLNQGNYRHELWMELEARPAKGYAFGYWKDAEGNIMAEKSSRLQLQSLEDISVQAVFVPDSLQVEVETWGGREHGGVRGAGLYEYGKNATLEAEPAYGYVFAGWYRADDTLRQQCLSEDNPYVFAVRGEERLAALFSLDKFSLSAAVLPEGSGSVRGTGRYSYLSEAILQMIPADGFALKYLLWEREDGQYDTLRENFAGIRMDRDYQVRVYFEPTPYTLQVFSSNTEQGRVQSGVTFAQLGYGSSVVLKAIPEPNYAFSQWRDAWGKRLSRSAEYTLTIGSDTMAYADFVPETKRFRAESEDLRKGYVEDYNNRPSYGSMVTVKAVPNDGYEFDRWVLASDPDTEVSLSSVLSVWVTQDTSFEARFKLVHREVKLHANVLQAGFIAVEVPKDVAAIGWHDTYARVKQNTEVKLYAYPAENYNFSSWVKKDASGQGGITLGEDTALIIEVNEDMNIEAVFEPKLYQVKVQAEPSAFGSVSGGGMYGYGENVTVKAVYGNYAFKGWKTAAGWVSENPEYTFTISRDTVITACFSQDTVHLTVYAEIGGRVSGGGDYLKGSAAVLEAVSSGKYEFEAWYDLQGSLLSRQNPYTLTVDESRSVRAGFTPAVWNIEADATEGGTVSGGGKAVQGSTVLLTAEPDLGYRFVRWQSESQEIDGQRALLPLLGVQATEDMAFTAVFEPLKYRIETVVSPLGTGTVTVGGTFDYGSTVSFEAKPAANQVFHAWTLNGKEVSTEAMLKTEVKEDAVYVAVFTPKRYNVVTSVYPARGGVAYGGGSYYWGDTAQIGIYLYDSVVFKNWSNADFVQVSNQPEYSYLVTQTEIFTASVDAPEVITKPNDTIVMPVGRLLVYPNPLSGNEELHIKAGAESLMSLRIFTPSGRYILYRKFSENGEQEVCLHLPRLSAGCYFYEIKLEDGSVVKGKLIKL